uniref:Succinate dehydrogenase [ubiquinone] cytochrome b small subunit n=1 Tax=Polytomella parva TaxID=51329 RepID=A0A7S0UJ94_9CHLO|eukprot:CAMPEP_0175052078 /NCGR_PEP_ID=MMETSP0052_2-20121109/8161_1 /TAXON_ID=51329 ORGANISM="Polytomella parva, Strain SAG 63-3" /NCGR_SAMPLE_ID=MMETSP0052_2 /ASSEMBLY_ACC=CAM_ASM_000194 /LENGTH=120 /DNA_ID=CAMNT_0016316445 /DNA_START=50 /DNA_END=412 /DNA_ORIENTATION=-
MSINFAKILAADTAGHEVHKIHEYASIGLAGATPIAALAAKDEPLEKIANLVLGIAIPIHSHVALNACVSDYIPSAARGAVRGGVLGVTAVTFLGLLKLNVFGAGITQSVKGLWNKPNKA